MTISTDQVDSLLVPTVYILPEVLHKWAQRLGVIRAGFPDEGIIEDKTPFTDIPDGRSNSGSDVFVGVYPHSGFQDLGQRGVRPEKGGCSCLK